MDMMGALPPRENVNLRVGVVIYPEQDQAMDAVLDELKERLPAQFILLADASGQLVSFVGERISGDLTALASLIAGDLAASQEIARLTGHYETFQLVLREGKAANTFLIEAGKSLVMFVQVAADVPLGWARLLIRDAGGSIGRIVASPPKFLPEIDLGERPLADAVADALDDLWTA
jgi:hypothetical protein